jgi:hypothetical protein
MIGDIIEIERAKRGLVLLAGDGDGVATCAAGVALPTLATGSVEVRADRAGGLERLRRLFAETAASPQST